MTFSLVNISFSQGVNATMDNTKIDILIIHFLDDSMPIYNGEASRSISWQYSFTNGFVLEENFYLKDYNTDVSIHEIDKVIKDDGTIIEGIELQRHEKKYSSIFHFLIMSIFINSYFID